jgi:hypothetical protein
MAIYPSDAHTQTVSVIFDHCTGIRKSLDSLDKLLPVPVSGRVEEEGGWVAEITLCYEIR